MISLHGIKKLVMGAAVDKCYSRCKSIHSHFHIDIHPYRSPTVTFFLLEVVNSDTSTILRP